MSTMSTRIQAHSKRLFYRLRTGTRSLGIDIGEVNTKLVIAERDGSGNLSYRAASLPTQSAHEFTDDSPARGEPSANSAEPNAEVRRFSWSTRTIKQLAAKVDQVVGHNVRNHPLAVGVTLSMSACDYRTLYVPKNTRISKQAMEQSIATALGDNRPRCVELLASHEPQSDARQTKLRCFSVAEDLAWSVGQQLHAIGLTPKSLNGLPWCVANALDMVAPFDDPQRIRVGIDWSYGNPTLVSIKQGAIDYVRCLSTGGLRELMWQAAAKYRMSPFEAGRWLSHCMQTSDSHPADAPASQSRDCIRDACTRLAAEIEIAVDFIKWRNQGLKLDSLWLMGGATRISGLVEMLQGMLPCELKVWTIGSEPAALPADHAIAASLAWMCLRHA